MKITPTNHQSNQKGFTIIELMIATLIFVIILSVIMFGVLAFTRDYDKGVNSSTTQNTARGIVDTLTQAIQFGGTTVGQPGGGANTYCIGNQQFDFVLYKELETSPGPGQVSHALWQSPHDTTGGCAAKGFSTTVGSASRELLVPNTRLLKLSVTPVGSTTDTYQVDVRIAYGDDDLLCDTNPAYAGDCTSGTTSTHLSANGPADVIVCKSQSGSQFCGVSELSTTVQVRAVVN